MSRLPRIVVRGQALHIIQRGNNRQACFFADDDYRYYLDCLRKAGTCLAESCMSMSCKPQFY
jgi:REP element-mobilizing transposase RayT